MEPKFLGQHINSCSRVIHRLFFQWKRLPLTRFPYRESRHPLPNPTFPEKSFLLILLLYHLTIISEYDLMSSWKRCVRALIFEFFVFDLRPVQTRIGVLRDPTLYSFKFPGPFGHLLTDWPGFFILTPKQRLAPVDTAFFRWYRLRF